MLKEFWKISEDISITENKEYQQVKGKGKIILNNTSLIPTWSKPSKEILINRIPLKSNKESNYYLQYKNERFNLDEDYIEKLCEDLLFEHYLTKKKSFLSKIPFDYTIIPPKIRVNLFNLYLKLKKDPKFPEWPTDLTVDLLRHLYIQSIKSNKNKQVPYIWFWPNDHKVALCITHDCDSETSYTNIEKVREIERKYNFKSCWNFVPSKYPLDFKKMSELEKEGCEVGIHDYDHTGKLAFEDEEIIKKKLSESISKFKDYKIQGFRSGLLQRNEKFLKILSEYFVYDSSVSDTDMNSPLSYRNGVCTVFPFFINKMVEIPITMPQDWRLIRMNFNDKEMLDIWSKKIKLITEVNGIININMHPDDFISGNEKYLKVYEELLKELSTLENVWAALPREVAEWWTERANSNIKNKIIEGSERAKIKYY